MSSVTYDNASNSGSVTAITNTFAHTTAGVKRGLTVCVNSNAGVVTGITYAGVAMTLAIADGVSNMNVEIWKLANPTIGANNVIVTFTGSVESDCTAISFNNVHTSVPFGTATSGHYTSTTTDISHDTTSQTGGIVVDAFTLDRTATSLAVKAGQTARSGPTTDTNFNFVNSTKAGTTTVTTGVTWVGDFLRYGFATLPVNPAADDSAPINSQGMTQSVRRASFY